jgi:DNA-binding NtrC family response regulator
MSIDLPPLRERKDDIPLLVNAFVSKWAHQFGKDIQAVAQDAMNLLMLHEWPGNVRELENTIERAVILATQPLIRAEDIMFSGQKPKCFSGESFREARSRFLGQFEETYLRAVLCSSYGNISKAARSAKMSRRTFIRILEKHKVHRSIFVSSPRGQ